MEVNMSLPVHIRLAQQIVDTLKSICDHDINYIDPSGLIRASTDRTRVSEYHEDGLTAARTGKTVIVEKDDPERGVRRGINMPILSHGDVVAVIGITGDPDEVSRYADLARRITRLLLREQEIDLRERNLRTRTAHLIRCLCENEPLNPVYMKEVLQANGIEHRGGTWCTAVIAVKSEEQTEAFTALEPELNQVFGSFENTLFTFFYPLEYVLIMPAETMQRQSSLLRAIAAQYSGILKIGTGSPGKLTRQHISVRFARLAIASMGPGINYAGIDDMDLELLFSEVSADTAQAYLHKCMDRINDKDRELLEAYFECDMSLKKTSELLFIHKNTLQYQLNRIQQRTGYDPRSFRDAAVLYTGLKLEKIYPLQQGNTAAHNVEKDKI